MFQRKLAKSAKLAKIRRGIPAVPLRAKCMLRLPVSSSEALTLAQTALTQRKHSAAFVNTDAAASQLALAVPLFALPAAEEPDCEGMWSEKPCCAFVVCACDYNQSWGGGGKELSSSTFGGSSGCSCSLSSLIRLLAAHSRASSVNSFSFFFFYLFLIFFVIFAAHGSGGSTRLRFKAV